MWLWTKYLNGGDGLVLSGYGKGLVAHISDANDIRRSRGDLGPHLSIKSQ